MAPELESRTVMYVFLTEMVFGFLFITLYLHAKVKSTTPSNNPGLVAFTIVALQYTFAGFIMKITGGSQNSTIGLAATTFRAIVRKDQDPNNIKYLPAYFFGPLIAGVFAGLFTKFVALNITVD